MDRRHRSRLPDSANLRFVQRRIDSHFLFIGAMLSLIALVRRVRIPFPRWVDLVPPYAIGSVAMFWAIQRMAAF